MREEDVIPARRRKEPREPASEACFVLVDGDVNVEVPDRWVTQDQRK